MAKPFQFALMLKLAFEKRDAAADKMRQATRQVEGARDRLTQVENYRLEYRAKLSSKGQSGITAASFADYQAFLKRLDVAHQQQVHEMKRVERVLEDARQAWMDTEREVKAFETLADRHMKEEETKASKREQKAVDEWVSNRGRRN